jgi:Carbohydrate binding domain/Secretion system C-terminal sorting domain/Right handed beta helix region
MIVIYFLTVLLHKKIKCMKNLLETNQSLNGQFNLLRFKRKNLFSFKSLLLMVIHFLLGTSAFATTYYVSAASNGNNNNNGTSLTTPWKTINYAVNYSGLTAGDIIYIRVGTYSEKVVMRKSGSTGNNITVSNYNSEEVIVDGTNITAPSPFYNFAGIFELRGSNVVLNGIKAKNARWDESCSAIVVLGPSVSNVTVQYCVTNNTSSSGIAIHGNTTTATDYSGCTNITIKNCDVSEAVCGGYQENLTIADGVDGFTICWNKVHDSYTAPFTNNEPLGIDAKTNVRNGKIYNNEVYNLAYAGGIYVDGYEKTAYNIDIYNNSVHHNAHSGISIGAEHGGTDYNINVYNNVIYKNTEHGFLINPSLDGQPANNIHDVKFYNNTVYGNKWYGIWPSNPNCYNIVIKNNIISQNEWSNAVNLVSTNKSNITVDYNVFNGIIQQFHAGTESYSGTNVITSDPVLSYPGGNNYRLQSTSPAINAGTSSLAASTDADGNGRPSGSAVDMGAYEYGATATTTDTQAPTVPTGLAAAAANITANSFTLSWTASTDNVAVTGYDIAKNNTYYGGSSTTTKLIEGLTCGTTYNMTVSAFDGASPPHNSSAQSSALSVTTSACSATNLLVNPGFESALTTGWTGDWNNTSVITSPKNSGSNALKVGPGAGGRAQILTSGFTVGSTYTVSAYCMLSGTGGPAGAVIGVICKNSAGARMGTYVTDNITNTGSFVKASKTFTVPASTTSMEVHVWYPGVTTGTTSIYVDDFALVAGSVAGSNAARVPAEEAIINAVNKVSIYPNPVEAKWITLSVPANTGKKDIFVYDMSGRLLLNQQLTNASIQVIKLNKNFLPGNYMVKVTGAGIKYQQTIMIK